MNPEDLWALIHPAIAILGVYPLLGIVLQRAWQTRQRRLQSKTETKSKIPPIVGLEHVQIGRWLAGGVVAITLIGLAHPIVFNIILPNQLWSKEPVHLVLIVLLYAMTIAAFTFLYQATTRFWRSIFAFLTCLGLGILGYTDLIFGYKFGIFRRENEWYVSHFFIGILAAWLMIVSLLMIQDIYQDRTQRWRKLHLLLNGLALLLFLGQGITGSRDLLEIPLSWQKPTLYQCNFPQKTCPSFPPPPQS